MKWRKNYIGECGEGWRHLIEPLIQLGDDMNGEVLLKLADGKILAVRTYTGQGQGTNKKSFLTVVSPGTYTSQDILSFTYTISEEGEVTWL